jgi:hypothetical protein
MRILIAFSFLVFISFSSLGQIKKRYILNEINIGLEYVQYKNMENGHIEYSVIYSFQNNRYKELEDLDPIVIIFKSQKELSQFSNDLTKAIDLMKPYLDEDIYWNRDKYKIALFKSSAKENPILAISKPRQIVDNFNRLSARDAYRLLSAINRINFGSPLLNPE